MKTKFLMLFTGIKFLCLMIIVQCCSLASYSQGINIYNGNSSTKNTKYSYTAPDSIATKRFWRATGEWVMAQAFPWASNRYIRKAGFAKISFRSIKNNFKPSTWEWDDNKFINNQFSHPYQGSMYFNAFRNNGYDFWESAPAVITGSFTWETILETHPPAPNDLVNSTLSGVIFGEMSNRLSKIILKNKEGKPKGVIRVPVAFIANPMLVISRGMDQSRGKPSALQGSNELSASFVTDVGLRYITNKGTQLEPKIKPEVFGRFQVQYGDPYTHCKEPFSNFSILAEIGNSDSANANILQIEGCIFDRKINQTHKTTHIFNISMNYDYYRNSSFLYSAQSFRANLLSRFNLSKNLQLQVKAGAGPITLAALPNTYMYYGEGRNYDYGTGISFQLGAGINIANKIFYSYNFSVGKAITINGYKSSHLYANTISELRAVIYKNLTFSLLASNYFLHGYYKYFSDVYDHYLFQYVGLGYKMRL